MLSKSVKWHLWSHGSHSHCVESILFCHLQNSAPNSTRIPVYGWFIHTLAQVLMDWRLKSSWDVCQLFFRDRDALAWHFLPVAVCRRYCHINTSMVYAHSKQFFCWHELLQSTRFSVNCRFSLLQHLHMSYSQIGFNSCGTNVQTTFSFNLEKNTENLFNERNLFFLFLTLYKSVMFMTFWTFNSNWV